MPKIPRWIVGLVIAIPCGYLSMFPACLAAIGLFRLNSPHDYQSVTGGYGFNLFPAAFAGAAVGGVMVFALVLRNGLFCISSGIILTCLQFYVYLVIRDPGSWNAFDSLALPVATSVGLALWGRRLRNAKCKPSATDDLGIA